MVLVPSGPAILGADESDRSVDPDEEHYAYDEYLPARRKHVRAFYIDARPVTNRAYKRFVDETEYPVPTSDEPALYELSWDHRRRSYPYGTGKHPVTLVTWFDALAYCEWAGKRLPSEDEWEKAARGTDGRRYPWGESQDFSDRCRVHADRTPIREILVPVDRYPGGVSPYGCWDMVGNAAEWCAGLVAPKEPGPGTRRHRRALAVRPVRGESMFEPPHVARRAVFCPWHRSYGIGFRCALDPPSKD